MSWAYCGTDSSGREIGYSIEAVCDEPGCEKEIDRGLAFACGGEHGEDEYSCERYFCEKHRGYPCPSFPGNPEKELEHEDDYDGNLLCQECCKVIQTAIEEAAA